jgi:WbqC-like protein family
MTIAVMQPYLFPYLGYYQLVKAVDQFIFFDDVSYINKGWINRNNTLQQNKASRFTLPLINASQNRKINEIEIAGFAKWRKDFLKTIEYSYKKAPFFSVANGWLNELLFGKEYILVGDLASASVQSVAGLLGLPTRFGYSSALDYRTGDEQSGQDKILYICKILGADKYINPKNGVALYEKEKFTEKNIELNFINMDEIVYRQVDPAVFTPYLSIIDVLMFNGPDQTRELLDRYTLS